MKKSIIFIDANNWYADFVPALNLVKSLNKEVFSIFVPKGYSNELRQKFPYFILRKEILLKCLRDYKEVKRKWKKYLLYQSY